MINTSNKFKVAAAQLSSVFMNKKKSVQKACRSIEAAAKRGAKLIVFPEAFIAGYPDWVWVTPGFKKPILSKMYSELLQNAVIFPDETLKKLSAAAKKNRIHVIIGVSERNSEASNSSVFNTILFFDDKGTFIGKHRKLIPTGTERLVWAQGDGSTLNVYDTTIGKIGGLACWENFMPLVRTALYKQGIQILAAPTWDSSEAWQISMRHQAKEGGMFIINCCQAIKMKDIPNKYEFKSNYPHDREWINKGNSCVIDPTGKIIAGPVSEKEEIIYSDIDLDAIAEAKWIFDVAGHYSRPDIFEFRVRK
ncbi:MAG: carbon-nitrogen hydrolase family protein [Ignavibacteria bacterium]|nr:carbon-nitrogen hydrolase family protein [Ignavibacteria bacterium]